ncbi:MAG: nucleoside 2-deoxyribosyltransferase [Cyanobacteria bacterium J06639_1]
MSETTYDFYIAGPLFNVYEQAFQQELEKAIAAFGTTFLPQRDCPQDDPDRIFQACIDGVKNSGAMVANLSGVDVDSGTAFEVGYAYALGKPVYGIRSEMAIGLPDRTIAPNLMLRDSTRLVGSIAELVEVLRDRHLP